MEGAWVRIHINAVLGDQVILEFGVHAEQVHVSIMAERQHGFGIHFFLKSSVRWNESFQVTYMVDENKQPN